MDILLSSNLERLIYEICDGNEEKVKIYMDKLKYGGTYKLDRDELERLNSFIQVLQQMKKLMELFKQVYDKILLSYGYSYCSSL